ncbi:hypothetical protein ZWY2020_010409, partial [Hordeum vulgare]
MHVCDQWWPAWRGSRSRGGVQHGELPHRVVGMSTAAAAQNVSAWVGITSMLPLVSAVLADSYWDRYPPSLHHPCSTSRILPNAYHFLLTLHHQGLVGLFSWAMLHKWMPWATLFLPLYLISIGQGAYSPSLQAFGADQLDIGDENEDDAAAPSSTGGTSACCGSLWGTPPCPTSRHRRLGHRLRHPRRRHGPSVAAFLCCTLSTGRSVSQEAVTGLLPRASSELSSHSLASVSAGKIRLSSRHGGEDDGDDKNNASELESPEISWLTDPKEANKPGVAKVILRLLPIWTVLLGMFAVIFQQPMTFFTKQGTLMDHRVGGAFVIPPATPRAQSPFRRRHEAAGQMNIAWLLPQYVLLG